MKKFGEKVLQKIFNNILTSKPQLLSYRIHSCHDLFENVQRNLGFPEPILYYLKKNASPKLLLQLMKTSKYFLFKEFPFLIVENPRFDENEWLYFDRKNELKILDFETLTKPLWITNGIDCYSTYRSLAISNLLSKTAICDIEYLHINDQIIRYNDFKILVSSKKITRFWFYNSRVIYGNGDIVQMSEIVKLLPNMIAFHWSIDPLMATKITSKTTKKFIKNLNPLILEEIRIENIPDSFNFNAFSKFMLKNYFIRFSIDFNERISNKNLKQFQEFIVQFVSFCRLKTKKFIEK